MSTTLPETIEPLKPKCKLTELKPKLLELYSAINQHWKVHAYSPSLDDLREALEYKSLTSIKFLMVELENTGWIRYNPGTPRSIVSVRVEKAIQQGL